METKKLPPKDWYTVGQGFKPFRFEGGIAAQFLVAMDLGTGEALHAETLDKLPEPLTAQDVLVFLEKVFEMHGQPRVGVVMSPSIWLSSEQMLSDPEMEATCKGLRELGCKLDAMADVERDHLQLALEQRGLRVEFESP